MDKKIKTTGANWYRLAIYNPNGGAEIKNFEHRGLSKAVQHATRIYHYQDHHDGAKLYQYDRKDTAGSYQFVCKIEEPAADE